MIELTIFFNLLLFFEFIRNHLHDFLKSSLTICSSYFDCIYNWFHQIFHEKV